MARVDHRDIRERKQHVCDRSNQRVVIPAWEVGPSNRSSKQRVAHEQFTRRTGLATDGETHAPRTMPWRMQHVDDVAAEAYRLGRLVEAVDLRLALELHAEHASLLNDAVVEEEIIAVKPDRDIKRPLGSPNARD